jgi:alkylation response protein AidB-like acyl-CoA dehydrogenase
MDFELNDEQKAYQAAARQFSHKELAPFAARWDAESHFPLPTLHKAGDMGFMSLYTPADKGGMGLSRLDSTLIIEELAHGCTATAAYITIHNMATTMIATYGTAELHKTVLPGLVSGELLASYCLTEPNAGSDAASLKTTARKVAGGYKISGSKAFISGAGATDYLVVMARTGEDGPKGISAFVLPASTAGIMVGRKESKMGWNAQPTCGITFDNVFVAENHRLGKEGEGFTFAMQALDGGRINIATCSLGTAQAALDQAHQYLQTRSQFGRTLSTFQALQFKFADMATELQAARQLVRLAAWKLDHKDPEATTISAMAKRFATDTGFEVCNEALQLHGGYGYIKEYPLERHVRDSRVHQILEGTNEIMRMIIARRLLNAHSLAHFRE